MKSKFDSRNQKVKRKANVEIVLLFLFFRKNKSNEIISNNETKSLPT